MNNTSYLKNITYQQEVESLKKDIYSVSFDEIGDIGLLGRYLTISANLSTFFPQLNNDEHYKIIQNIQFHRSLSNIEQFYPFLLENLKINDEFNIINRSYDLGQIIVTYHTGSYRMLIQYLNKKDIPFCLVTEEQFIKDQGPTVQKLYKQINKHHNELEILPAENPRLIFELTKRLRNGISVIFYIDGNTGSTTKKLDENKNLLKINFLNHHIYARQGIAFLAYLSKSPLSIIIAKRDENLNHSISVKPIETLELLQKYSRDDFINKITLKLYGELEDFLKTNLEQWEGWFYIHKFFNPISNSKSIISEKENTNNYKNGITVIIDKFIHLIKYDDEHVFLVKKKDYQIMRISTFLYDVLTFFKTPKKIAPKKTLIISNQKISWNFVKELIEMKFLIPL